MISDRRRSATDHPADRSGDRWYVCGATYARAIDNYVAFGALAHDELMTDHEPNERAVLANLHKAMDIYAQAVYALACS